MTDTIEHETETVQETRTTEQMGCKSSSTSSALPRTRRPLMMQSTCDARLRASDILTRAPGGFDELAT
jgi:hypothetical protein